MNIHSVRSVSLGDIQACDYDIAIFGSGFEPRCAHLVRNLDVKRINKKIVIGFSEHNDDPNRVEHDIAFKEALEVEPTCVEANNDHGIYKILMTAQEELSSYPKKILVDYTSMSRTWYSAILNWARTLDSEKEITLDYCYSAGLYPKGNITEKSIDDIICMPGLEGAALGNRPSISIFGLGFDRLAPYSVFERTEPDEIYAFYANPGSTEEYPLKALNINSEFINEHVDGCIPLSLFNVDRAYASLCEVVSPYLRKADVSIIPLGPKPHILASILVALKFSDVSCLHVKGLPRKPSKVTASGDMVLTRISLESA